MTNRSTYETTCKNAQATAAASISSAAAVAQEAVNAASLNGGTSLALGVSLANDAKIRTANAALQVSTYNANATKQAAEQVALDLLRSQGDVGPR